MAGKLDKMGQKQGKSRIKNSKTSKKAKTA